MINKSLIKSFILKEQNLFLLMLIMGLVPLLIPKYFLTLDGASHFYNGNIIKELILGNYSQYGKLFELNPLLVPNWISHFLFASLNLFLPAFIAEKLILASYLVLFPLFFRKIILFITPENKVFTYLPIVFAHNHLLYFGFFNLVLALVPFLATVYYILKKINQFNIRSLLILSSLFLVTYFSHILIYLLLLVLVFILPFNSIHIRQVKNKFELSNWNIIFTKIKIIGVSVIPSLILAINYLVHVDSLEKAGRMNLDILLKWIVDIRTLLTLCYCKDWYMVTHILMGLFLILVIFTSISTIKRTCSITDHKLTLQILKPNFKIIWLLFFLLFALLFLIVPNANLLSDRLILLTFIFFIMWISVQKYPKWIHRLSLVVILIIHSTFVIWHTKAMKSTSNEVEMMTQITPFIPEGSLLLPFNYAKDYNWLHSHSTGYLGSEKSINVIENYEAQLKWFPVKWNLNGPYELDRINVWGVQNKNIIKDFFINSQHPTCFSLPLKNGEAQEIEYVTIIGHPQDKNEANFKEIQSIIQKNYSMIFQNDFCKLYQLK